jgi:hypothetical protein
MKLDFSENSEITFQTFGLSDLSNAAMPTYSLTSTAIRLTDFVLPPIYCIGINKIDHRKGKYRFTQPIIAIVGYQDGLYSMENKELDIITMSRDYNQCFQDFKDEVLFILKEYGEEDNNNLTSDARKLKTGILRYLKK